MRGFRTGFVGLLVWLVALVAQPALAQTHTPQQLQFLEQRLAALANENPGEYGMAALDLRTGEMVHFNGNRPFPMASTMKIAVAAAYLQEVDAGRRSLHETIAGVSAERLLDAMITRSDNRATDILIETLGGPGAIDRWIRFHRISGMRVDRNIAQLLRDRRDLMDVRDSSTPIAMLGLLRLIDSGNVLTPRSRWMLLDMMRRCRTGSNRIRGLLPRTAAVENKTGTLNGYTGDVGYVTLPDGRRIAVVFFARGGSNRPAVISTAARAIYDGFAAPTPFGGRFIQAASSPLTGATALPTAAPSTACSLGGQAVQAQC